MGWRDLKQLVTRTIAQGRPEGIQSLLALPARKVINPLIALLCSADEIHKWRAVSTIGRVVAALADADMESARVIMRRFIWQLNDESGGIGWGVPEAMAEIMHRSDSLAAEYAVILASYILEDQNFLEHPELQKGLLWGVGRLAERRPELMREAVPGIAPFLTATDPMLRGLAARAAANIGDPRLKPLLERLADDQAVVSLYLNDLPVSRVIAELARTPSRDSSQPGLILPFIKEMNHEPY